MFSVVLNSFKNIEAAKEFLDWFEGQGEQDIQTWWECRQSEGKDIGESPQIDLNVRYKIINDSIHATVKND